MLGQRAQGRQAAHRLPLDDLLRRSECVLVLVGDDLTAGFGEVEPGRDDPQRPLQRQQGAPEQRHRGRRSQLVTPHHVEHLADQLRVDPAALLEVGERGGEIVFEGAQVHDAVLAGEVAHGAGERIAVPRGDAERDPAQALQRPSVEASDSAEIEQPDRAGGVDHDVAGMRVGVVERVVEHLPDERRQHPPSELGARDGRLLERALVADRVADHLLHRQEAIRRQGRVDGRNGDPHVARSSLAQTHADRGLVRVVELLFDAGDQLLGERREARALVPPRHAVRAGATQAAERRRLAPPLRRRPGAGL